jgi:hypothetical protein
VRIGRLEKQEALVRVVDEEAEGVRREIEGEARGGCVEGSEHGGGIGNLGFPVGGKGKLELGWVGWKKRPRRGAARGRPRGASGGRRGRHGGGRRRMSWRMNSVRTSMDAVSAAAAWGSTVGGGGITKVEEDGIFSWSSCLSAIPRRRRRHRWSWRVEGSDKGWGWTRWLHRFGDETHAQINCGITIY